MPLRDHFRPPVSKKASWEGFHGMWPASIVQQLRKQLPPGYVAEPRVHLGTLMEIDVGALEPHEVARREAANGNGNAVTAAWTATAPVVAVETDPPDEYEYEVRIFDLGGNASWSRPSNSSAQRTRIDRSRARPLSPSAPHCSARESQLASSIWSPSAVSTCTPN